MVPRFVHIPSLDFIWLPALRDAFKGFFVGVLSLVLNSGVFPGEDGGIQHAGRLTGVFDNLEGKTD